MITSRIYGWARSRPTKPAVICDDQTFSYVDFARAIEAARRFFEQQSFSVGHTVIVLPGTRVDDWVFALALRALGLNTVCIPSIDQADVLKLRKVGCIVASEDTQQVPTFNGTSLERIKLIMVPSAIFSSILQGDPPLYPHDAPPFGGHILLSSGTTGAYKKVFFDGSQEDMRNAAGERVFPLDKNTTFHVVNLGLWTGVGFGLPSAVWHSGGCVVMDGRPDNFFRHAIDLAIVTPSMLTGLVRSLGVGDGPAHDNCELLITSGFLPLELAKETARRVTKKIGISYGCTELGTPVLMSRGNGEGDMYWLAPTLNRTIRIVDGNGNECPPGQEGELCIKLMDFDCKSYLDDEEASAKVFRDGFFRPGDIAVSRADGRVRILGRAADVLNVWGQKIAVAPMELEIQRLLRVDEVCLFSGLTNAGKEELVVAVQTEKALPASELDQIAREFSAFEQVRFAFFKEFPRTTTGTRKVKRSVLRKLVFPEHKQTG